MKRLLVLTLLVAVALTAASVAGAASGTTSSFTLQGTVTSVVDGDTVDVRLAGGKRERVRMIGIDTPERGTVTPPRRRPLRGGSRRASA